MHCSSCGAPANSCDWCVTYASLRGAHVHPQADSGASDGDQAASAGAPGPPCSDLVDRHAMVKFLREFNSGVAVPEEVSRPAVLAAMAAPPPSPAVPARCSPTFGRPWEAPSSNHRGLTSTGAQALVEPSPGSSQPASAPVVASEILPCRPDHHRARRSAAVAAVLLTICGVTAGVVGLPSGRGANGGPGAAGGRVEVRGAHSSPGAALTTVPARYSVSPRSQ
jgi:hypothetical protein